MLSFLPRPVRMVCNVRRLGASGLSEEAHTVNFTIKKVLRKARRGGELLPSHLPIDSCLLDQNSENCYPCKRKEFTIMNKSNGFGKKTVMTALFAALISAGGFIHLPAAFR